MIIDGNAAGRKGKTNKKNTDEMNESINEYGHWTNEIALTHATHFLILLLLA